MKKYTLYMILTIAVLAIFNFIYLKNFVKNKCDEQASTATETTSEQQQQSTKQDNSPAISYFAEVKVPVIKGENILNALVLEKIAKIQSEFAKEALVADNETFAMATESSVATSFELSIRKDETITSKDYISFMLYIYQFSGGAHGNTFMLPINFDVKNKKLVSLQEVVKAKDEAKLLETLSAKSRELLSKKLETGENKDSATWIEEGTTPNFDNFKNFKIEGDKLRFIFDSYQVAPYSEGMPEILIDIKDLQN